MTRTSEVTFVPHFIIGRLGVETFRTRALAIRRVKELKKVLPNEQFTIAMTTLTVGPKALGG